MTRADDALVRLYEDTGWREDLIDSEANTLLKWAENKLFAFDVQAADETDFETRVNEMRRVLTHIDKFVARNAAMTPDERQTALDNLASLMQVTPLAQEDLIKRGFSAQAVSDNAPMISALTAWLDGADLPLYETPAEKTAWGGQIDFGTQAAVPAAEPPPIVITDPAAMSAILGFFTSAPPDTETTDEDEDIDDAE